MRWHEFNLDRRALSLGVFVLLVPLAVGCKPGKGTVSGTVTLDGQPLPVGNIAFIPSKGPGAGGAIEDGKFSVDGVPAGKVTVTVETATIKKQLDSVAKTPPPRPGSSGAHMTPERMANLPEKARAQMELNQKYAAETADRIKNLKDKYRAIPEKYSKADSSGLTFEVKSGPNTFDVPLSSK